MLKCKYTREKKERKKERMGILRRRRKIVQSMKRKQRLEVSDDVDCSFPLTKFKNKNLKGERNPQ